MMNWPWARTRCMPSSITPPSRRRCACKSIKGIGLRRLARLDMSFIVSAPRSFMLSRGDLAQHMANCRNQFQGAGRCRFVAMGTRAPCLRSGDRRQMGRLVKFWARRNIMNDSEQILAGLGHIMPIKLGQAKISKRGVGLVIVDEVNGFATVGAGYLAPPVENPQVSAMI